MNEAKTYPDGSQRVGCPPFPELSPLEEAQGYQSLIDQSYVNQAFNIGITLLGTGANIYGWGANENLWGSGMPDNAGNVIQPYFSQPKQTRGSLWSWNKGFAT